MHTPVRLCDNDRDFIAMMSFALHPSTELESMNRLEILAGHLTASEAKGKVSQQHPDDVVVVA